MIKKLMTKVRKLPPSEHRALLFASAKDVAVTFEESGMK